VLHLLFGGRNRFVGSVRTGYKLSRLVLKAIVRRYGGKDEKLAFSEFVLALTKVVSLIGTFWRLLGANCITDVPVFSGHTLITEMKHQWYAEQWVHCYVHCTNLLSDCWVPWGYGVPDSVSMSIPCPECPPPCPFKFPIFHPLMTGFGINCRSAQIVLVEIFCIACFNTQNMRHFFILQMSYFKFWNTL